MVKLIVGKLYKTRDDKLVECLWVDERHALMSEVETLSRYVVYSDGTHYGLAKPSCRDVVSLYSPPVSGWVNVYSLSVSECLHATKEEADRYARKDRIRCVFLVEQENPNETHS